MLIDKAGGNKKTLARNFWFVLQKNNQYKDLPKIVAELDKEYARENNSVFAEIISENKLSDNEMADINKKISVMLSGQPTADHPKGEKKIISKNIVKENFGPGIIVKTDEMEMDVSAIGKIDKLRQQLNN